MYETGEVEKLDQGSNQVEQLLPQLIEGLEKGFKYILLCTVQSTYNQLLEYRNSSSWENKFLFLLCVGDLKQWERGR